MGSLIEINDTLRISKEQGFPLELDINKHLVKPYELIEITSKVFEFKNKANIRVYKIPPVRNFLVEDIKGKWLYWGLCHIVEIKHDYLNQITSGKFKIIKINTHAEMVKAFELIHNTNIKDNYFNS